MTNLEKIISTFEELATDIAEGKYTLEEATYDEGSYRTVFVVSVMRQNKEGV